MWHKAALLHCMERLGQFPLPKVVFGLLIWGLKLLFGSVFRPAYGAVIVLWLADTATGFYQARVNPDQKPESRRLYHGLVKLGVYMFLLMLGHQCGLNELTMFIQAVIESFIIFTESYSVLENLQKISTLKGTQIPLLEQIMKIIQGQLN